MIAATPPVPVCSTVSFDASGLACGTAPLEEPFSCPAGKIVTLTVHDRLVCVALHPVRQRSITRRR